MRTRFSTVLISAILIFSGCGNRKAEIEKEISDTENKLYGDSVNPMNVTLAREAVKKYDDFVNQFPDDPKTPEYLFRAGELCMSLMKSNEAIGYFKKIHDHYPAFPKAPDCLFLQGFIYENQLKRLAEAQALYNEFLKKYPDHNLADDAQFSLKFLGKSEEEIIKEFEKNNPQKSDSVNMQ
ncbi:MAG: tetratricopeptide repeat protein [Bacteroidetes bacterium]|nr:tetratricopeptide repeat protein [Bacteroidota bacterium]